MAFAEVSIHGAPKGVEIVRDHAGLVWALHTRFVEHMPSVLRSPCTDAVASQDTTGAGASRMSHDTSRHVV